MWIALTMVVLFVALCWYGSADPAWPDRANVNEVRDEQSEEFHGLIEMLDEASKVETTLTHHQMGFMTPDQIS